MTKTSDQSFTIIGNDQFQELSDIECQNVNGGNPFLVAMAAVLCAGELYQWGYNYASSRLNQK